MEDRKFLAVVYSVLLLTGRCCAFIETTMPNEFMICRPVAGLFGALASNTTDKGTLASLQGPQGQAGPPGRTGLPGPKGAPNYQKVSQIAQEKLQSLSARLFKLESEITAIKAGGGGGTYTPRPTSSPEDSKMEKDCMAKFKAPIYSGTSCYSVIGGEGLLWTFSMAESNCTKLGGYVADLNSRELYDKIYEYIDVTYSTVVQAWTGMRFETNKLLLTDGQHATFVKWMAYNPRKSTASYTSYYKSYTYVFANIDTSSRINGMQNAPPSRKLAYAICHFDNSGSTTVRRSTTKQTTTTDPYYDSDYDYY